MFVTEGHERGDAKWFQNHANCDAGFDCSAKSSWVMLDFSLVRSVDSEGRTDGLKEGQLEDPGLESSHDGAGGIPADTNPGRDSSSFWRQG